MPYGYGSTNRERGAEKARSSSSSSKSKSSSAKSSNTKSNNLGNSTNLGDNDRQSYSAKQYTNSGISASKVKASKESFEDAVGKSRLDNYNVVESLPKYTPAAIRAVAGIVGQKLFETNRKFFREKVLKSKNSSKFKDTMDSYSNYIKDRLSGTIDAYGNLMPGVRIENVAHNLGNGTMTTRKVVMRDNDNGEPKDIQKKVIAEMQKEVDSLEPEKKITAQRKVFKNYRSALRRRFLMEEPI